MLQYPVAALCTELWKSVGDTSAAGVASALQRRWTISPSPSLETNTTANAPASSPEWVTASCATASDQATEGAQRRRSAGGSNCTVGRWIGFGVKESFP